MCDSFLVDPVRLSQVVPSRPVTLRVAPIIRFGGFTTFANLATRRLAHGSDCRCPVGMHAPGLTKPRRQTQGVEITVYVASVRCPKSVHDVAKTVQNGMK